MKLSGKEYRIPSRPIVSQALPTVASSIQGLEDRGRQQHLNHGPNNQFAPTFTSAMQKINSAKTKPMSAEEINGLLSELESLSKQGIDEPFRNDINSTLKTVRDIIMKSYSQTTAEHGLYEFLLEHMPRTVYFKTYERLEDEFLSPNLRKDHNYMLPSIGSSHWLRSSWIRWRSRLTRE